MGAISVEVAGHLIGDVAEACFGLDLPTALGRTVEVLAGHRVDAVAWVSTDDGWERVAGGDATAPLPDAHDDAWSAGEVSDGGRALAVIMVADPGEGRLAQGLAGVVSLAASASRERARADAVSERFATNQRISGVGSYDWHIATDTNIWTDALFRIYGCEPGSFQPSYAQFLERIHPDDRDRIQAIHQKAYEEGGRYEMHERIVWPDGTVRTLWSMGEVICDDDGTPVRMVGVCEDVTEKLIEQEKARKALADLSRGEAERAAALELNDNVVQGLTAVAWALDAGMVDPATEAARKTLQAARDMMDRLLNLSHEHISPGDLVRTASAPNVLPPDIRPSSDQT